jgi:hypothetical protein
MRLADAPLVVAVSICNRSNEFCRGFKKVSRVGSNLRGEVLDSGIRVVLIARSHPNARRHPASANVYPRSWARLSATIPAEAMCEFGTRWPVNSL